MPLETHQKVNALFSKVALSHEAKLLKSPQDWEKLSEIRERHRKAQEHERKDFSDTYADRLKEARQKVIAQAGSKVKNHTGRFATDQFSQGRINARADKIVRQGHEQRLAKIDQSEARETHELIKSAQEQNRASQSFTRATSQSKPNQPARAPSRSR